MSMATPESNGLVSINGKPKKERGFNCMRLITFLTNDGVTDWGQWHGAHLQAASGHCPYSSECPNYKHTVEKYINPY